MSNRTFFAKIFLFGEYSVIFDSMGLTIPYELFEGSLKFRGNRDSIDQELKLLASYLKSLQTKNELGFNFDINSFQFDVGQGLYFDSTIPQGHGVGSSGALCAALYQRYGDEKNGEQEDITILKKKLSVIESYFHGQSSGVDPLNSYLNRPLLIKSKDCIEQAIIPDYDKGDGAMFLLSTGRARKTEPLVNLFFEKLKSETFSRAVNEQLIPITNSCIQNFLEGNIEQLWQHFNRLSAFQFEYMNQMIPSLFKDLWKEGLEKGDFNLKLCGAGGGGFLLGMTQNLKQAQDQLQNYEIRPFLYF